jgi:hypothetical protein
MSSEATSRALPPEALVVRGGTLQLSDLENAAAKAEAHPKFGRPGVSVFGAPDMSPAKLVERAGRRLPHTVLCFTRAGRLYDKGYTLEQTLDWPHHTAWLPEVDDREFWLREFRSCFYPAISREGLDDYRVEDHESYRL